MSMPNDTDIADNSVSRVGSTVMRVVFYSRHTGFSGLTFKQILCQSRNDA